MCVGPSEFETSENSNDKVIGISSDRLKKITNHTLNSAQFFWGRGKYF
jgi:hypothetical protein